MEFTDQGIQEFINMCEKERGERLTTDEARAKGESSRGTDAGHEPTATPGARLSTGSV